MYVEFRNFAVDFRERSGRFNCFYADRNGKLTPFLRDVRAGRNWRVTLTDNGETAETAELKAENRDGSALFFRLFRDRMTVTAAGKTPILLSGVMQYGSDPLHSTFAVSGRAGAVMLRNACGPAVCAGAEMLYDRESDTALGFTGDNDPVLRFDWQTGEYRFDLPLTGTSVFSLRKRVCADLFALRQWRAVSGESGFPAPPVGWMTWYAVRFAADEETVLRNARRMRELFGDYAEKMILWVDWEWCHRDLTGRGQPDADVLRPRPEAYPHGLRYVADRLKELGLVPALWSGATNDGTMNALFRKHPEWLLGEADDWCGRYWADCSHPEVIAQYFPTIFRQILRWGYQAIKFDCWARTLAHSDQWRSSRFDPTLSSEAAMRKVLESVRRVIGGKTYFLGCLITDRALQNANDCFDAARIGGDVFSWDDFRNNAVARTLSYYPMHNTAWHLDPDALILREQYSTAEQARTRASFVALTGMVFTIGDDLDALDDRRIDILRRTMPPAEIHPVEIIRRSDLPEIGISLTAVCRPHGNWFVAGLYNFTDQEQSADLDLAAAGLPPGRYAVYDFWEERYLGVRSRTVRRMLPPGGCAVLRLTRTEDVPTLAACTGHILQGALELSQVRREDGRISGKLRTVAGRPVTLGFHLPAGWTIRSRPGLTGRKNFAELRIHPEKTGFTDWEVAFLRTAGSRQ